MQTSRHARSTTRSRNRQHEAARRGREILDIVNARMANLIRKVSIESGHDPAEFALYAYGGATSAPCRFRPAARYRSADSPYAGPVFSALGVAIADISYSHSRSEQVALGRDAVPVVPQFRQLRGLARADMTDAGFDADRASTATG